ncbi:hypothetical protein EVAR_19924_1 [Eumeta japonica]|uniref:Uncharacterized protein n=1 Tax=Eumeta variegata TaxID=151549 RepID=A0A4C1ZKN7_EUMVA|nr:hypothetical protein EVAR_19924_1 [Eumeta japonica]
MASSRRPSQDRRSQNIFNNLNMVCGLSGIRVEAPHERRSGQCHRCQLYGHAAANCHADPLREMLVPHWTRGARVLAVAPPRDLNNFPDLAGNKPTPAAASRPVSNPWGKPKPTHRGAAPGPSGEAVRGEPPVSLPASATAGTTSFGDDIQTVMSILRAVKSSEISEFARDFQRAVTSKRNSWFSSDTIT